MRIIRMLQFYSNENLAMDLVKALRDLGYNALTSYEANQANQGIPDDQVLAYAIEQNRTVITLNRDDFLALHRSGVNHRGIIICKDDREYMRQAEVLHNYLEEQVESLENRLIRVQKQNQPKSSQKIFVIKKYLR
jgi:predicted nuclease of predicted toxin-antitoxin system